MDYSQIAVSPLKNHRYIVIKQIVYRDCVVPSGYPTNGANIPRILWSFIPPNRSDILPAVIIHDCLCDRKEYEKADEYFKEILELLGVEPLTVWVLHSGVSFYSKFIRPMLNLIRRIKIWFKV